MKVKELLKLISDNNIDGNTKIKIAKAFKMAFIADILKALVTILSFTPRVNITKMINSCFTLCREDCLICLIRNKTSIVVTKKKVCGG